MHLIHDLRFNVLVSKHVCSGPFKGISTGKKKKSSHSEVETYVL